MTMKKNKLFFLLVASFLSLGSLTGCNVDAGGGQGGGDVNNSSSADNQGGNQGQGGNEGGQGGENQGGNEGGNEGGGGQSQGGNEGGGGQGQGGNEGGGGQGGNETITDWTDEQKTTMRDNLYGVVLPYISVPLVLRQDKSQLVFYGTELSMPAGTLSAYAQKFTEQDGWSGGDVSSLEGMSNGCIFSFNKAVDTKNGKRFVNATFMGFASTGSFDPNGRFTMYASDPYDYEYPQEMINGWLSQQFGTDCYIPVIQADYYNLYEEGTIYCFSSTNIEESVKALFLRAGFTIDANRDSEGFYVAHPSDGSYLARFKYDNDMKALILKAEETKGWNASLIKRFYTKYNQTPLEFPALDIDGASYKFAEDDGNAAYASAGLYYAVSAKYTISKRGLTNQPLEIYADKLREAGYSVNSFGGDNYSIFKTLSDGILYISRMGYDAQPMMGGNPQIVISFLAAGQAKQGILVNWPAQDIQRYLGADLKDSVPAYTGRQFGYQFDSGNGHALVSVYLDSPAASSIKNAYVGLLTEKGYTLNGKKYVSKNEEIAISLGGPEGEGSYQMFQIAIEKIEHVPTAWPTNEIAAAIVSNIGNNITDAIPALDVSSATECYVNKNYTDYHFEIIVGGLASSIDSAKGAFKTAGWTEDANYEFDYNQTGVLVSPNKQMVAYFYTASGDLVIGIKQYFGEEEPIYKVVGTFNSWNYDRSSYILVDATNPDEVAAGKYVTQLMTVFHADANDEFKIHDGSDGVAGWFGGEILEPNAAFTVLDGNNIKVNAAGYVTVYFKTYADSSKGIALEFVADQVPPELKPWPEEELSEFFGDCFDAIPEIKVENASYEVYQKLENQGMKIAIVKVSVSGAADAMAQATRDLCSQFSYQFDEVMEWYATSIENYPLYNFVSNDENSFYIMIMYMPSQDVPEATWEAASAEIAEYFEEEEYALPNLEIEGATSYLFDSGTLTIAFPEETDMDAKVALVKAAIQGLSVNDKAYHYSRFHDAYVNVEQDLAFAVYVEGNSVIVEYDDSYDLTNEGYGIIIEEPDEEGGYEVYAVIGDPAGENEGFTQYLLSNVELKAGMRFYVYDFNEETDFRVSVNSYSLDSNYAQYFKYDEEQKAFIVKQDANVDIYIKLKMGQDEMYVGPHSEE